MAKGLDMDKIDRIQMIKDRRAVKKFIYETGKNVYEKLMHTNISDELYLNTCKEIINLCNNYPENSYGKPNIYSVMSEAYRRINYDLSEIEAHAGF
jgi:hypothetical protein